MGHLSAMGMAEAAPVDLALHWHLTANHYPPLPAAYVPLCKEAIELAVEAVANDLGYELWDRMLDLPEGVNPTPRQARGNKVSLSVVVDIFHLEAFIDQALSEYFEDEED